MHSWSASIRGRVITATLALGVATLAAGCAADPPAPATPAKATSAPTVSAVSPTLTGKWRDEKSNVYEFTASGTDSYSGQVVTVVASVCTPINIKVSATAGHFEGTMAFYKVVNSVCGEYLGDGTVTVELDKSGSTAQVKWAGPAAVNNNCLNCAPHTWTRLA